ncbi:PucR family transcriptional regulator [Cohnella zeiphila]|uniref:PucR family transcriptional regulator ligand-binding domain-containing protein n=1 Tax=Cohnella zeiphila TaxID=2761120 RepID=A0A7X0SL67_9BACL|nr:PucR family transcriptional regulator [Cohnella zeiphila]MBB6732042.1 PucR family transcriptional regulator ligand-binding domain-containing protein [Cohnella zeiphila]
MYLTVEDALKIYPLSEGKLTAGQSGVSRIVKSVNVMDAPDISDWVREGDILFTTAYLMKDAPSEGVQLLRKLARKGAAGIGIKLGRFWANVPDDMLAEADRLGFPLIELPFPFTFSDQMKGLFNAELQRSTKLLHGVLDKQKELMRFALAPKGAGEIFQTIGCILGVPLAVVGLRGQVLYTSLAPSDLELLKKHPQKPAVQLIRTERWNLMRLPLRSTDAGQDVVGSVVFQIPRGLSPKEEEGLYHQAAEMISHHLNAVERHYMEQSTQNEFASLLRNYLKSHISIDTLLECAARLGIPFGGEPYRCAVFHVSAISEPKKERLLRTIRQELQYNPLLKDLSPLHFPAEDSILSILPAAAASGKGKLAHLLNNIFADVAAESGSSLRISLSHTKHKPEQLDQAYRECADARDTADRLGIDSLVTEYETVEMAYIFQSVPEEKMRRFLDMTLSPIIDKAPDSAQDLLRTLELYIENNGQINETAKQLYIHRNTAAYRLDKIGELLQVEFKSYSDLLKLKLVLLFKHMLKQQRQ